MCVGVRGSVRESFLSERFARLCKKISVWRWCRDALGHTKFLRHHYFWAKTLCFARNYTEQNFFGQFFTHKTYSYMFWNPEAFILWKNPCAPPRTFLRTAALKPKPFETSSHNVFFTQKVLVPLLFFKKITYGEF